MTSQVTSNTMLNSSASHTEGPCPQCGYCPHCGRGGYRTYPYPYYPSPWWTQPYTLTSGTLAGGNTIDKSLSPNTNTFLTSYNNA